MFSIQGYSKKCKVTQGGCRKLYLIPYVEYGRIEVQHDGMNLIQFPESDIYLFDVFSGNYNQLSQADSGAQFFNQSASLQLSKVYEIIDIHLFLQQQYRVIVETNNGDNILFGTYNGMDATVTNTTGTDKAQFNGFALDFNGMEEVSGLLIENLEDFFNIRSGNLLNAVLNFTI